MADQKLIEQIAAYAGKKQTWDLDVYDKAMRALLETITCSLMALKSAQCDYTLGPIIPGSDVPLGSRLPASDLIQDPVKASFDMAFLSRFLNFAPIYSQYKGVDICPVDTGAALFALAEYLSKKRNVRSQEPLLLKEFLECFIKAYEIYGLLSSTLDLHSLSLERSTFAKVATAGTAMALLRKNQDQVESVIQHAFADGFDLMILPHEAGASHRCAWIEASAVSRAMTLVYTVVCGERPLGSDVALAHPLWKELFLKQADSPLAAIEFDSAVIRDLEFKQDFPGQRHCRIAAQLAASLKKDLGKDLESLESLECVIPSAVSAYYLHQEPLGSVSEKLHSLKYSLFLGLTEQTVSEQSFLEEKEHQQNPLWSKISVVQAKDSQQQMSMTAHLPGRSLVKKEPQTAPQFQREKLISKFEASAHTLLSDHAILEIKTFFADTEKALQTSFCHLGTLLAEKESFTS